MLNRDYNFGSQGDDIYRELLEAHQGLTPQQSTDYNARLLLILMNHIGDAQTLREAIATAKIANGKDTEISS